MLLPPVEVQVQPKPADPKLADPPKTDIFAQAPMMSEQFPTGFNPHMLGDFPGYFVRQTITVFGVQTVTTTTFDKETKTTTSATVTTPTAQARTILVPVASLGAFKIAENASPKPQDRVFFAYNYYGGLGGIQNGPNDQVSTSQPSSVTVNSTTVTSTTNTFIPRTPTFQGSLNREIFGFEKTFLDGFASVEVRLPLLQQSSTVDGLGFQNIGDLTIIGKYAFLLDQATGNVLSSGLAVTAPTGPSVATIDGSLHSTLLQPWFGYIWNADRFFVQAFHSVVVPTDARDVTLLFNDVGLNFWLYRNPSPRFVDFIVPSFEVHVTTPLNHRSAGDLLDVPDLVVLTSGIHVGLFRNGTLSLGVAVPVTGPQPFHIEAFTQLNWRF